MVELDTSRAPRGVLAAQTLIAAVAEHGDLAERHYLELKSTLDLSAKKDKEKIAKFILGASNRMPDVAAAAFEGYGVMIIGVAKGAIVGIPPVEMMEISKVIQQYVGAAGPRWDIVWVPIEGSTNQVLVILVEPPRGGQGPFACRASGESLTDGRVYVRADGETREANSDEFDLLMQRGAEAPPAEVDFAVEVTGEIASSTIDEHTTLEEYLGRVRADLLRALPAPDPEPAPSAAPTMRGTGDVRAIGYAKVVEQANAFMASMTEPERRTREQYLESIDTWEERFREAWFDATDDIVASQFEPVVIKVVNRTTTFFHDVEVRLHLEGDVFALECMDPVLDNGFNELDLPAPPRKWGPRSRGLDIPTYAGLGPLYTPGSMPTTPPSISFRNSGSVDLDLDVGDLRPRGTYESEDGEIVLYVADSSLSSIHGTWELTARGHNEVYSGEIEIAVAPEHDLTAVSRAILGLELNDDEGGQ